MSLWWWPGLAVAGAALVASFPTWGWCAASAVIVAALTAEFAMGGWRPGALAPAIVMLLLSGIVAALIVFIAAAQR